MERLGIGVQVEEGLTNDASGKNLLSGEGTPSSGRQLAGLSSAVDRAELCRCTMLFTAALLPLLLCVPAGGVVAIAALLLLPLPARKYRSSVVCPSSLAFLSDSLKKLNIVDLYITSA